MKDISSSPHRGPGTAVGPWAKLYHLPQVSAQRGIYHSSRTDCLHLAQGEAEELWAEVKAVIKMIHPHRPNITREEQKALIELREDNNRIVLTADKGACIVVIDREEYIKKAKELLIQATYKVISANPTTKQKNKLITLLKNIKAESGISEET